MKINKNFSPQLLFVALIMILSFNLSAQKVKGDGKFISQDRGVLPFESIELDGDYDVILEYTVTPYLKIDGDEALVPFMQVNQKGKKITVSPMKGTDFKKGERMVIRIGANELKSISLSNDGSFTCSNSIPSKSLKVSLSNSGKVELKLEGKSASIKSKNDSPIVITGEVKSMSISQSGKGDIDANGVKAETVSVDHSGKGDITINATKSIDVKSTSDGNIMYRQGVDERKIYIKGKGKVVEQ